MRFRLYDPQDFAALYAIEETCFEPPQRFSRGYMRRLVENPNSATWIAEQEGQMAGFAIADWAPRRAAMVAYIQTLEVTPAARGRGVGGQLLRRIEGSARTARAKRIWLHVHAGNASAIRLYEAHGYRIEGSEEDYYGLGEAALIYAKQMGSAVEDDSVFGSM